MKRLIAGLLVVAAPFVSGCRHHHHVVRHSGYCEVPPVCEPVVHGAHAAVWCATEVIGPTINVIRPVCRPVIVPRIRHHHRHHHGR